MSSKFIVLITCSSFLRAFAEEYFLVPPNHRMNKPDDGPGPFVLYCIPTIVNVKKDQSKRVSSKNNNNNNNNNNGMVGYFLSRYMKPPDPDAVSSYSEFHGQPMAETDDDELPTNHRPAGIGNKKKSKRVRDERPTYSREHDPFAQSEIETSQETKIQTKKKSKKPSESLELSPDDDRVEFQIQGHEGPATYVFGYDTGDGKNRQFRLEERLRDGSVKGHYGYYDARGKLRTVRYFAHPSEGYKEKHHESNKASSEED